MLAESGMTAGGNASYAGDGAMQGETAAEEEA